jgi:transcriptional regulator with XRE-family HTH domain
MPVADGVTRLGAWGRYLREIADRPGWTVARIARDAGLNRTTVFDWIRDGDGRSVTIGSVLAVAKAAGDPPLTALRAAADLADDTDPEIDDILMSTLPEQVKVDLIESILDRRRRESAARREDLRRMIRLAGGQVA